MAISQKTKFLEDDIIKNSSKINLFIFLGLLGDFDSFEYTQALVKILPKIIQSNIKLQIFAIGDEAGKELFCSYTKLPNNYLTILEDNKLHIKLDINQGLDISKNNYLD